MYSNNQEYRQRMREYFKMDVSALAREHAELKDTDPESYDELLYDNDAVKNGMNLIYDNTKDNPMFRELYRLAAGRFLTEDLEVGLCVLLTYDYFHDFIKVYESGDSEHYERLLKKLS
jgi:hypothetical protein